ncbi:PqqD family protein [Pseudalkalibacillus hwajinpoensis]|uniref:PqqD family protein n=1 Tax=Guptibacillus hwajinpoensis TaxID=208199 RepID=UPI00325B69B8
MKRYIQNKTYDVTRLDDEYVVLNTDNYTVTKLNGVGGFCWSLLHEEQTVDSLLEAIHKEFPEDEQPDEGEIEEFIMDLIQCELVHHVS